MDVLQVLKERKGELQEKFHLKRIGVFGSVVSGTPTEDSDIDILVEFEAPVDFFEFLELKEFLEQLLGKRVDLVTPGALKRLIKDRILDEVVYA